MNQQYYTLVQLKAIARERGLRIKGGTLKKDMYTILGITEVKKDYPPKDFRRVGKMVNIESGKEILFPSLYIIAKTIKKKNIGSVIYRINHEKTITLTEDTTMWKDIDTKIPKGIYYIRYG